MAGKLLSKYLVLASILVLIGSGIMLFLLYDQNRWLTPGMLWIGALGIGMTEHVGVMRGLITSRTPLGDWKDKLLASPNRVMEAYVAHSQL